MEDLLLTRRSVLELVSHRVEVLVYDERIDGSKIPLEGSSNENGGCKSAKGGRGNGSTGYKVLRGRSAPNASAAPQANYERTPSLVP